MTGGRMIMLPEPTDEKDCPGSRSKEVPEIYRDRTHVSTKKFDNVLTKWHRQIEKETAKKSNNVKEERIVQKERGKGDFKEGFKEDIKHWEHMKYRSEKVSEKLKKNEKILKGGEKKGGKIKNWDEPNKSLKKGQIFEPCMIAGKHNEKLYKAL